MRDERERDDVMTMREREERQREMLQRGADNPPSLLIYIYIYIYIYIKLYIYIYIKLYIYIPLLAIDPVRINKKKFDRNEHERIL